MTAFLFESRWGNRLLAWFERVSGQALVLDAGRWRLMDVDAVGREVVSLR